METWTDYTQHYIVLQCHSEVTYKRRLFMCSTVAINPVFRTTPHHTAPALRSMVDGSGDRLAQTDERERHVLRVLHLLLRNRHLDPWHDRRLRCRPQRAGGGPSCRRCRCQPTASRSHCAISRLKANHASITYLNSRCCSLLFRPCISRLLSRVTVAVARRLAGSTLRH